MTPTVDERLLYSTKTALHISLGLALLSIVIAGIAAWSLPSYVPIWFSRPFGENQLAIHWMLFIYPVLLAGFFGGAFTIYRTLKATPPTLAVYFWLSSLASALLFLSLTYVLFLIY